jgi:hypothetical protein
MVKINPIEILLTALNEKTILVRKRRRMAKRK